MKFLLGVHRPPSVLWRQRRIERVHPRVRRQRRHAALIALLSAVLFGVTQLPVAEESLLLQLGGTVFAYVGIIYAACRWVLARGSSVTPRKHADDDAKHRVAINQPPQSSGFSMTLAESAGDTR
jgi:hypothetical protein